jgi:hypothetical protein
MKRQAREVYGFGAGQRTRGEWPVVVARLVLLAAVLGVGAALVFA